jgi:hypothetical protein
MKGLGIIAGKGDIVYIAVEKIQFYRNIQVIIDVTGDLSLQDKNIYKISPTDMDKIIDILHKYDIKDVIFIGKIEKRVLFGNIDMDRRARYILSDINTWNDIDIMHRIVKEFEYEGFNIINQIDYLKDLTPHAGILTSKRPTNTQQEDITYGFNIAKKIACLGIGQTIVVKNKTVVAVEAIEGTDKTIIRAGELAGDNTVVIKVSSPKHDFRFDTPTVGEDTICSMGEVKASVLAIEAEKTFLIGNIIEEANKADIVIVAV